MQQIHIFNTQKTMICSVNEFLLVNVLFTLSVFSFEEAETRVARQPRIIGGQDANITEFPYIVSLQYRDLHVCGGSLLQLRIVITAAHCCFKPTKKGMEKFKEGELIALMGTDTLDPDEYTYGFERRAVVACHLHEKYLDGDTGHDLALLLLSFDMILEGIIQFTHLKLEEEDMPRIGSKCVVAGWGVTRPLPPGIPPIGLKMSKQLKKVELYFTTCPGNPENEVCTYDDNKDACFGDSGGPLICGQRQIAVVSHGEGCAVRGSPGYYYRCDNETWIQEGIELLLGGNALRVHHNSQLIGNIPILLAASLLHLRTAMMRFGQFDLFS